MWTRLTGLMEGESWVMSSDPSIRAQKECWDPTLLVYSVEKQSHADAYFLAEDW